MGLSPSAAGVEHGGSEFHCARCDASHALPTSSEAELAALALMAELEARPLCQEGKMHGVLLATDEAGGTVTLRAFSGRVGGATTRDGWVPPIPEVDIAADEARTFAEIEAIQASLAQLAADPVHVEVRRIEDAHERHLKDRVATAQRARSRGVPSDAGADRRALRAKRQAALAPLLEQHGSLMDEVAGLKRQRRALSHSLHARIRAAYRLPSPAGVSRGLEEAFTGDSPGGSGDCCAPKLLVEASRRGLRPTGLVEFWWGPASRDGSKLPGTFHSPCAERCQPILGHLLCDGGLTVIYEDAHLMVVDKPAGLASVPGPTSATHDSVQARVQLRSGEARPAHRLDVDTSGLLLIALDAPTLVGLSAAFRSGRVAKRYVAILEGPPPESDGLVELRAAADGGALPRQRVDPAGKLARTRYRVLEGSRVEFEPLTGRTHQIRLAAREGLGHPIVGDRLYGRGGPRLMLHASGLALRHPVTDEALDLSSPPPF